LIQENISLWYEEILFFFTQFDLKWLEKLYICLNILDKNPLQDIILETNKFAEEFIEKMRRKPSTKKDLLSLGLLLKERISYFNEKYQNLQLSMFSLENLNKLEVQTIDFVDLDLLKKDVKKTPCFFIWAKCFELGSKTLEAGERVVVIEEKKSFIIWKRVLAKMRLMKLEEFGESGEVKGVQESFVNGLIEMVKKYFFSIKKKILLIFWFFSSEKNTYIYFKNEIFFRKYGIFIKTHKIKKFFLKSNKNSFNLNKKEK